MAKKPIWRNSFLRRSRLKPEHHQWHQNLEALFSRRWLFSPAFWGRRCPSLLASSPFVRCFLLLLCVLFAWVCPACFFLALSSHGVFFVLYLALPLHACCAPEESRTYRCSLPGKAFVHPILFFSWLSFLWFYV